MQLFSRVQGAIFRFHKLSKTHKYLYIHFIITDESKKQQIFITEKEELGYLASVIKKWLKPVIDCQMGEDCSFYWLLQQLIQ